MPEPLKAHALMRPRALVYLYLDRLRVHAVQELLAGLGVAIGVGLVLATTIASASLAGSAGEVVHAVVGPASLQLRARTSDGFEERLLRGVEHLPGVEQAAPLLEQTATIRSSRGKRVTVDLAGADTSLVVLDGLAHKLPIATLSPGGLGLSTSTAHALGLSNADEVSTHPAGEVSLDLRGRATPIGVSAVLGPETFGALAQAQVAVMPLADLQRLAGLKGRISRILVQSSPGRESAVRSELQSLAGGRIAVASSTQDVTALKQALRPSSQASDFFAAISALLGFLLAFNALLLTAPERRQTIAELRVDGTRRSAIMQVLASQALFLGIAASAIGLATGYLLSLGVLHESSGYLDEAFTIGSRTVLSARPLLLAFFGGVLATCVASAIPLLDLRRGRELDAIYAQGGVPGNALSASAQRRLAVAAGILLAVATAGFTVLPTFALASLSVLALASVCVVPLVFVGVLRAAGALTKRYDERLSVLSSAITSRRATTLRSLALVATRAVAAFVSMLSSAVTSLRGTTLRSLALAATGVVALFGSVALGGARNDLLRGVHGFAHSYSADASIWVSNPGDNQATSDFVDDGQAARIAQVPGVEQIHVFQGGFLQLGNRRAWVIARPPGANRNVLDSQISGGNATQAIRRLGEGGWIAVSKQIAEEQHVPIGGTLTLPTPTGNARFKLAATTTNLAWPPGVIFIDTRDYRRFWRTSAPTALGIDLRPGTDALLARSAIARTLGSSNGLEVATAGTREESIDALADEGLGQLGQISTLLLLAAILALVAAGTSAVWQRRASLAELRVDGVKPARLRRILLIESALMLGAGCFTGAVAGIYGQVVIDAYLKHITGFPVASLTASWRPLEIFALVIVVVLAIVTIPGWFASRVSPMLAFNE